MIIACDFDGTIVEIGNGFPEIGADIPGAIETLKEIQAQGHRVIIWTCRAGASLAMVVEYLEKKKGFKPDAYNANIGKFDGFAVPKIFADFYIDDRSLPPFPGWDYARRVFKLKAWTSAAATPAPTGDEMGPLGEKP